MRTVDDGKSAPWQTESFSGKPLGASNRRCGFLLWTEFQAIHLQIHLTKCLLWPTVATYLTDATVYPDR